MYYATFRKAEPRIPASGFDFPLSAQEIAGKVHKNIFPVRSASASLGGAKKWLADDYKNTSTKPKHAHTNAVTTTTIAAAV